MYSLFPLLESVNTTTPATEDNKVFFTSASRESTLQEIIDGMSASWRQVLGTVELPPDDGRAIAKILDEGGTVQMWSDGTVKNGIGAHAYTLRTQCEDHNDAILGDASTSGNPNDISSLRPESYGGLACMILTWAIEYKYGTSGGYILMHIDNEELVKRLKCGVPDAMVAEKCTKTDFDVWFESSELASHLKLTVCAKWVSKGHQDKYIEGVYAGIGPIGLEAKFNILTNR